jgi:hypothetical protein
MKQTLRQLVIAYYSVYIAAIAAATSGFYILKSGFIIDPLSQTGTTINTLLIIFIIGSVPLTLGYFNKLTKKWALLEDENQRLKNYRKAGTIRIAIIGLGLVLGVLFFYIMNSQSMIFSAGIAAIALFFCKPSEAKISAELGISL